MSFEDIQPWLDRFGARDFQHLCRILDVDAFPDALPVYRGPLMEPGLDIWGAKYSWAGVYGSGYSRGRGGYPLASRSTVAEIEAYRWPQADDFDYSPVRTTLSVVTPKTTCLDQAPVYFPPR